MFCKNVTFLLNLNFDRIFIELSHSFDLLESKL